MFSLDGTLSFPSSHLQSKSSPLRPLSPPSWRSPDGPPPLTVLPARIHLSWRAPFTPPALVTEPGGGRAPTPPLPSCVIAYDPGDVSDARVFTQYIFFFVYFGLCLQIRHFPRTFSPILTAGVAGIRPSTPPAMDLRTAGDPLNTPPPGPPPLPSGSLGPLMRQRSQSLGSFLSPGSSCSYATGPGVVSPSPARGSATVQSLLHTGGKPQWVHVFFTVSQFPTGPTTPLDYKGDSTPGFSFFPSKYAT